MGEKEEEEKEERELPFTRVREMRRRREGEEEEERGAADRFHLMKCTVSFRLAHIITVYRLSHV